jgi:hypothetical protein
MVFSETIIPLGTVLYKGLDPRKLSCETLLKDTRLFFLTEHRKYAKAYGNACPFRVTHKLRLFDLTHKNLELLMKVYPLSNDTKMLIRLATGTGITVGKQTQAIAALFGSAEVNKYPNFTSTAPGQRMSYKELNKIAFGNLTREFLIPEKYDGYYARTQNSAFHEGMFHSEIMLTNAYHNIERVNGNESLPVISKVSIVSALPRIFAEFCKGTTRLTRPYGGGLVIFCTGGMAVKMYMQQRRVELPYKIRRTSDFDFSFAVPGKLKSEVQLSTYVYSMRKIMSAHMNSFIKYLNREYEGCNARLRIMRFVRSPANDPRMQIPTTRRRIYQVITYQVLTGENDVTDLVDTALAVYPGIKRTDLHLPFSYRLGIPIQRLRYQFKDALALLSGSFLYGGLISHRNPITGKKREKGEKDVARVERFLRVIASNKRHYANLLPVARKAVPLMENISRRNVRRAKLSARRLEMMLKKIK